MAGKRRSFQDQVTAEVAIEAIKGKRPGSNLIGEYRVSAGQPPTRMVSDRTSSVTERGESVVPRAHQVFAQVDATFCEHYK